MAEKGCRMSKVVRLVTRAEKLAALQAYLAERVAAMGAVLPAKRTD